ncbi:Histidine kinase [Syntrophus gentianae]|uniref:Histidine kinase n=1 Tax=Syntrophus gentianae TaxID=43775 RepID=A0A1H7UVY7_9BACT|nr:PAS domain-containing sensor histidine kinase [Syntrophus gentianae]SEM01130.1 Histidine kinase [Syntrophus gentianae]
MGKEKEDRNNRNEAVKTFDDGTAPGLSVALKKAEQQIEQFRESERKLKKSQRILVELTDQLTERVKELNCLYEISGIMEKQGLTLEEALQQTVDVIPKAWKFPEIACSRIILGDLEFQSAFFSETSWRQTQRVLLHGKEAGFLDVFYSEVRPQQDEGPFLKEERSLIKGIAERIGEMVVRKRAEEALQESQSQNRALLDAIPDLMFQVNEEGVLLGFHQGQFDLTRFIPPDFLGRNLYDIEEMKSVLPRRLIDQVMAYVRHTLETGGIQLFEQNIPFSEERKDFEVRMVPYPPKNVLAIVRDITRRKRLEREILEISGREQRRIGQDLHDSLCQHLAGIGFMGKVLEKKIAEHRELEPADVSEIVELIDQAITMTRGFARGLNPVRLEAEGFRMALCSLAGNVEKLFGISCPVRYEDNIRIFDPAVATHLYRIVQEALNNAIKHGKADTVTVALRQREDVIVLSISDNGCGIRKAVNQGKGMGLNIMEYRASMIGASLEIADGETGGTRVTCSFTNRSGD